MNVNANQLPRPAAFNIQPKSCEGAYKCVCNDAWYMERKREGKKRPGRREMFNFQLIQRLITADPSRGRGSFHFLPMEYSPFSFFLYFFLFSSSFFCGFSLILRWSFFLWIFRIDFANG